MYWSTTLCSRSVIGSKTPHPNGTNFSYPLIQQPWPWDEASTLAKRRGLPYSYISVFYFYSLLFNLFKGIFDGCRVRGLSMEKGEAFALKTVSTAAGIDRYRVEIAATLTGEGILVLLTGGEQPHIGAVVLSVPRASLTGAGISCDSWILPVPGHKDAEVAQPAAELICRATGQTTVITAGIHIEPATSGELQMLLNNCTTAVKQLLILLT